MRRLGDVVSSRNRGINVVINNVGKSMMSKKVNHIKRIEIMANKAATKSFQHGVNPVQD